MKKFWKKYKGTILTGTALVVGLKVGSKYHESVQKGFTGVENAGKSAGEAVKSGACQAYGFVTGLFAKKTPENEN